VRSITRRDCDLFEVLPRSAKSKHTGRTVQKARQPAGGDAQDAAQEGGRVGRDPEKPAERLRLLPEQSASGPYADEFQGSSRTAGLVRPIIVTPRDRCRGATCSGITTAFLPELERT